MSGYVIQYVPLTGLGQPVVAELRQVSQGGGQILKLSEVYAWNNKKTRFYYSSSYIRCGFLIEVFPL